MPTIRQVAFALPVSLFLTLSTAAPLQAAIVQRDGDDVLVLGDDKKPISGVNVDIVSTDGTLTTQGFTNADGAMCVLGRENPAVVQGRPGCIYLPDGDYQLFVTDQEPVRFSVSEGVIELATAPRPAAARSKKALITGGVVLGVAALAGGGGGGGGGGGDDDPEEPVDEVSVSVEPQMLTGEFEFGVSPCPTVIGELTVTNTGDVDARITVTPIEGISTTGQGQLVEPGDSRIVTVLFNCLQISAIAGAIEVGLTNDGQADSDSIEIVVDFL